MFVGWYVVFLWCCCLELFGKVLLGYVIWCGFVCMVLGWIMIIECLVILCGSLLGVLGWGLCYCIGGLVEN